MDGVVPDDDEFFSDDEAGPEEPDEPKVSKTDYQKMLVRAKEGLKHFKAEVEPCPKMVQALEERVKELELKVDQATPPDKKRGVIETKLKANKLAMDKVTSKLTKDKEARANLDKVILAAEQEEVFLKAAGDKLREQLTALRKDEASYIAAQGKPLIDPEFIAYAETLPDDGESGELKQILARLAHIGANVATKVAAHSTKVNVEGRVKDSEGDHEMAFEELALESTELDEED